MSHGPPDAAADAPCPGLRILVVEDLDDAAQSLSMLLRIHGHQVEVAPDGPGALEAARRFGPDVVLLDIGLPGALDGWAVARRLRQMPWPKQPLLVAVTGYGQERDHRASEEAGIDLHLVKPADPLEVEALLRRLAEQAACPVAAP
jgi:CheY-like chemotaxis protein